MRAHIRHLVVLGFTLALSPALAQTSPPVRIRGVIEKVDGSVLDVKTREGQDIKLKLDDKATTAVVVKATLADIKPNSFIGTAALPQPDGTMKALEVHIFPEAMRGTGEGFRDYDLKPKSTMTNAPVTARVESADGPVLTLTYKGGEKKVVIPADCPIVTYENGSSSDIKVGAGIVVQAADKQADGTFKTSRVTVGRDGVNPPM